MSDQETAETKTCPYCGRATSVKANFCYWCARELAARPERPDPTPEKKAKMPAWAWGVVGGLALAGILAAIFWR